jgi:hypothetical protein
MAMTAEPIPFSPDADYVESPQVREVARDIINRHDRFRALDDFRIVYLERLGDPTGEGEEAIAKCQKASPLWRDVAGVDLVIWDWRHHWLAVTERQREALVAHELCHPFVTDKGTLKLVKHDLEEFHWIARQYGPWLDDVRVFGQQLAAFSDEPTPLESKRRK